MRPHSFSQSLLLFAFLSSLFSVSLSFSHGGSSWSLDSWLRPRAHGLARNARRDAPSSLSNVTTRATAATPSGWTYLGCAVDGNPRALSYSYVSSSLTQETCISSCDSLGYTYAGMQFGQECWCGNSLANGQGGLTSSSECNMPCKGDASETCGASYRLSLFSKSIPSYTWSLSQACVVDTSSRLLQGFSTSSAGNTVASCQSMCANRSFSMAGVENGNECYCGNSIAGGTPASAPVSDCSVACAGNTGTKCGGGWRMQIYTASTSTSTATTTTATTSTSTSTSSTTSSTATTTTTTTTTGATSSTTSSWVLSNACVVDTNPRVLQPYATTLPDLTPTSCQSRCAANGYTMAGVENGNECYCGNSFTGGKPAVAAASDCSTACNGNTGLKCGGGWRIQVYTLTAGGTATATTTTTAAAGSTATSWSLANACLVDTSARILSSPQGGSTSLTPASCQSTCASQGFSMAGVENGNECYCGNSFSGGTPAAAPVSECSALCTGNSALTCGGGWRIQVYTAGTSSATTSATTTMATTTTTTTSTATSTGWVLSNACVVDTSSRIMQGYQQTTSSLTPTSCQNTCASQGFSMAGVQDGNECYCANAFSGGAPAVAPASDCNMACKGNSALKCGAAWRMQVYALTASTSTSTSTSTTSTTSTTTATSTAAVPTITEIWETTYDLSKRLTLSNAAPISFGAPATTGVCDINVDETTTYQTMDGFGASLTESSASMFVNLKNANYGNYQALLHQLFDMADGSYSAMSSVIRVPLGASDFSSSVWSYCDSGIDTSLSCFNIEKTPSAIWTVLYDILAINPLIKIHLVPWSPPGWMKDSGTMLGGTLLSNYYDLYANYLLKAARGFQNKGIPVYALAIQNEPEYSDATYPSCLISASAEAYIGTSLRALLNNNGMNGVKILGYEHNYNDAAGYPVQLMQQAPDAFAGAAFHCYGGTVSQVGSFRSAFPGKEVHLTECSGTIGSDWWSDVKWYMDNLYIGGPQRYAKTALMWNLALDGAGNPKLPGSRSCSASGCRGVVTINYDGTWAPNQEFWAIAQTGKAVAPKDPAGSPATRIAASVAGTYAWALRVSAYATKTRAGTATRYSLVVLNWRDYASSTWNPTPQPATINFRGMQVAYTFPVGITTLSWYA
ncbi:unnamed protein product [Mycena citricolor]|uniref:WSC domain-containing protein n=1 Tax=Mycena citricolor TaxID=2018698 RepID=A0AAD2GW86_9AGAR|nr:unnamed protein product [Mycena citricolor]